MSEHEAATNALVGELADAIYEALFKAWEESGDPAIIGAVLSLVMTRFLEAYTAAAGMPKERHAAFFERSIETHAAAIRTALSVKEELN